MRLRPISNRVNTSEQIFSVKNKIILITGGAGFLGMRYVEFLATAGAKVAIIDALGQPKLEQKVHALPLRLRKNIDVYSQDITDQEGVRKVIAAVLKRWGRIDALVNNAALTYSPAKKESAEQFSPYEEYPLDLWKAAVDTGLTGTFIVTQVIIRVMKKQRSGVIVNIGSVYGEVAHDSQIYPVGRFGSIAYAVTKGALPNFTRELASYLARFGVRVNTLTLGGVENAQDPLFVKKYSERTMLGRMGEKDDYNGAILFLLSDASRYMTGANLIVDGGWTAW